MIPGDAAEAGDGRQGVATGKPRVPLQRLHTSRNLRLPLKAALRSAFSVNGSLALC
jgi:hypothetical protein